MPTTPDARGSAAGLGQSSLQQEACDAAADHLRMLVDALYAQLRSSPDPQALDRGGWPWSPRAKADFLAKSAYIIDRLQAISQALELEAGHNPREIAAELFQRAEERPTGEEASGVIPGGDEADLVGSAPEGVEGLYARHRSVQGGRRRPRALGLRGA
jgi:hypothetical protein